MKLAVSSYSFHQYTKAGKLTLQDLPAKAAELGFAGIEYVDLPKEVTGEARLALAAELGALAKQAGLEMVAYTVGANLWQPDAAALRAEIDRLKGEIDVAVALGAPLLRHDLVWGLEASGSGRSFLSMMPDLVPSVREIADYAAQRGVKTCSENHGRLMQDSYRMEELFYQVDHKNYGLLCDIGNFGGADEDCAEAVSKLLPHICFVHAKDAFKRNGMMFDPGRGYNRTRGGHYRRSTIFGHGDVPSYQILAAIKQSGYDGYVSLEFEGIEDTLMAIEIGSENLKRMLASFS